MLVATKETGLEENVKKQRIYSGIVDLNVEQNRNTETVNRYFESTGKFKYLTIILESQNSMREEISRTFFVSNACYHSIRYILSFPFACSNQNAEQNTENFKINYKFACSVSRV